MLNAGTVERLSAREQSVFLLLEVADVSAGFACSTGSDRSLSLLCLSVITKASFLPD
jgi:hypothetical protein